MDIAAALELVLRLAQHVASTEEQEEACRMVEDFIVNELGDD